jgi:DNA polymerase III epsilon subunit-like protein
VSGLEFYIADTETNGLDSKFHECLEVGIIRCKDRVQLHKFIKCEYPERSNFDSLKITNKTLADIVKGDSKEDAVKTIEQFISEDGKNPNGRCIIAHNASFDRRFMHALWQKCDLEFPASLWLDTVSLTKEYVKKVGESNLKITKTATGKVSTQLHACLDMLEIKKFGAKHEAKTDSRNTYLLWMKLLELGVNYLPHIKTFPHDFKKLDENLIDFDDPNNIPE